MTDPTERPSAVPALHVAARHLAAGRPDDARRVLAALVDEAPAYVAAHVLLARALESAGDTDEALAAWQRAAFLVPASPLVAREHARLARTLAASAEAPEQAAPDESAPDESAPDGGAREDTTQVPPVAVSPQPSSPGQTDADQTTDASESLKNQAGTQETHENEAAPASEAAAPPAGSYAVADELESLIESLSNAPRIRPDPAFEGPAVSFAEGEADEVLSETLARIYAAQQQYARAALIYEKLAAQRPAQADDLRAKAAEMRRLG